MEWILVLPLLLTILISSVLVWKVHKGSVMPRLSSAFIAVLIIIAAWSFFEIMFIYASTLDGKTLVDAVSYIPITLLPVALLHFSSLYSGRGGIIGSRGSYLIFFIPIVTIALAFTNGAHGLIWKEISLITRDAGVEVQRTYGAWFWIHITYSYGLILAGIYFVISGIKESPSYYKKHYYMVFAGIVIPLLFNIVYITLGSPINGIDYTPAFFFVTMVVLAYAVFSSRFLDIMPLALRRVFGVLNDALIILDIRGNVVDMNQAAERLFSTKDATSGNVTYEDLGELPPLSSLLESEAEPCYYEVMKRGERHVYSCDAHTMIDKGIVEGYIISLRDVTPEMRERKALERLNTHLMVYNKMIRHDIANSIMAAQGYVSLIETEEKDLQLRGLSALQRGIGLIKMFNKIESFITSKYKYETLDLNPFIASIASSFPELSISIRGACTIEANDALGFVFNNLFHNALVHGKSTMIEVAIERKKEMCYIDVIDDGTGIPTEREKKIFHEGSSYGKNKGSGLGLNISRWIVRELGGDITLQKRVEGKGAHFQITLPLTQSQDERVDESEEPRNDRENRPTPAPLL
ncbi:PAS domain-containing protein [archaeon]|nr:MAG: PAS domain-containing protein [archaeon]